jgi:hypothetical protein
MLSSKNYEVQKGDTSSQLIITEELKKQSINVPCVIDFLHNNFDSNQLLIAERLGGIIAITKKSKIGKEIKNVGNVAELLEELGCSEKVVKKFIEDHETYIKSGAISISQVVYKINQEKFEYFTETAKSMKIPRKEFMEDNYPTFYKIEENPDGYKIDYFADSSDFVDSDEYEQYKEFIIKKATSLQPGFDESVDTKFVACSDQSQIDEL